MPGMPKHEFWQAPRGNAALQTPSPEPVPLPVRPRPGEVCARCETEFVLGSRFCHVCGLARSSQHSALAQRLQQALDLGQIRRHLGLSAGAFLAFLLGVICLAAAMGTGLVFNAMTVLDWEAVQLWRIQWLLAAAAAFLAGIMLKR